MQIFGKALSGSTPGGGAEVSSCSSSSPGRCAKRRAGEAANIWDRFGRMRPDIRGSLPHVHKRYSIGIFRRSPLGNRKVNKNRLKEKLLIIFTRCPSPAQAIWELTAHSCCGNYMQALLGQLAKPMSILSSALSCHISWSNSLPPHVTLLKQRDPQGRDFFGVYSTRENRVRGISSQIWYFP